LQEGSLEEFPALPGPIPGAKKFGNRPLIPAIFFKELLDVIPKTPIHTHSFQFTVAFIPMVVRNSSCAARIPSLSSCVYRFEAFIFEAFIRDKQHRDFRLTATDKGTLTK
jgi:hypothetical protein